MKSLMRRMGRRSGAIAGGILVAALFSAGSYATVGSTDESTETTAAPEVGATTEDAGGVHGGPQLRIHEGCDLAEGLTGNWTHGDYVSAVAQANQGDSEKISEAAQSDCGKVDHSAQEAAKSAKKDAKEAEETGKPEDVAGTHGKSDAEHGKSAEHRPSAS